MGLAAFYVLYLVVHFPTQSFNVFQLCPYTSFTYIFVSLFYLDINKITNETEVFQLQVKEFFQSRIERQYPLEKIDCDEFEMDKAQHESFMRDRGEFVFGREKLIEEVSTSLFL